MQHSVVEFGEDQEYLMDHEAFAVADCLEFCEALIQREYGGEPGEILTEPYLPVDGRKIKKGDKTFEGTTAGYCDKAIVSKCQRFADIIDWKFGMFSVTDAEQNIQGMSYLLGLVRKFPKLERVTVHFISPHRDEWSFHTFRRQDFRWIYLRVVTAVRNAVEASNLADAGDFSRATPGQSACLFCARSTTCPVLTQKCIDIGRKVRPLELPADLNPRVCFDPKNAGIGLKLAAVVKSWAEDYRRCISEKTVDELDYVPKGYILVTGQKRVVVSVSGIREISKTKFGFSEDEVDSASDIALGKLEKILEAKTPRGSKEAASKEFSAALIEAGYVEKTSPYSYLKMEEGVKTRTTKKKEESNG